MLLGGDALGRFALGQIGQGALLPPVIIPNGGGTSAGADNVNNRGRRIGLEPPKRPKPVQAKPLRTEIQLPPWVMQRRAGPIAAPRPPVQFSDPAFEASLPTIAKQVAEAEEKSRLIQQSQDDQDIADIAAFLASID